MSAAPSGARRLVLVAGAGRSGTSTMAGLLQRLGLVVPQPEVPPDESNPRGFYEPLWAVELHKELLERVPARTNDARPDAARLVDESLDRDAVRAQVAAWLAEHAAQADRSGRAGAPLLVKDPRTLWFTELWCEAAAAAGLEVCFVTMLRHPAAVARSRDTHYLADRPADFRTLRQTANVASWVNGTVTTERLTRGRPRAFVRYDDLLADWRSAVGRCVDQLGLDVAVPPADEHHAVDDFVDVRLDRSRTSWDDVSTSAAVREVADAAWEAADALVDDPVDVAAVARLGEVGERYALMHREAEALTLDHTGVAVQRARREVRRRLAQEAVASTGPARPRWRVAAGRVRRGVRRVAGRERA